MFLLHKFFPINFIKFLNSLNSLMKFMIFILNSVSLHTSREFLFENISIELVDLCMCVLWDRESISLIFHIICTFVIRSGHVDSPLFCLI